MSATMKVPREVFIHKACTFLEDLGVWFEVNQYPSVMLTALSLMHGFYSTHDYGKWAYYEIAPACLTLAAKVDDEYGRELGLRRMITFVAKRAAKNDRLIIDETTDAGKKVLTLLGEVYFSCIEDGLMCC